MVSLRQPTTTAGELKVPSHSDVRPTVLILGHQRDFANAARRHLGGRFVFVGALGEGDSPGGDHDGPDAIVLDVEPPADPAEVLDDLESAAPMDVPIVLITEASGESERASLLERGALDVLDRSVAWDELGARLQTAVRLRERLRELRLESGKDALTTLPDRERFGERIEQEVARSSRSRAPLSVLILDVDRMAGVNARLGHRAGDGLLALVAQTLRSSLRLSDSLFRWGGDEFAAILPDTTIGTARVVAERVLGLVRAVHSDASGRWHVAVGRAARPETSASIGVAELSPGRTARDFLARAEQALGRARDSGGNQVWRADDRRKSAISTSALAADLTDRERVVLEHLANRGTDREIANRMRISVGTVRSHKARIRRKLQIPPDVRLADFARAHLDELQ